MEQIAHSALRVRGDRGYARIATAGMPALLKVALLAFSATNLVEPLSNGLRLSMTQEEIVAKFGPPSERTWDPRVFGYPQFVVEVGGVNQTIWRVVLKESVSLRCGVRIGSSRQQVIRAFGGADQVVHQNIRLRFAYRQNQLIRIEIEPAAGEFARSPNDSRKAPREVGPSGSSFLGTWYGANVKIQITLQSDGTYVSNVGSGRYAQEGAKVTFTGPLRQWNRGRARVANGALEFHWKDPDGSVHLVAFSKDREIDAAD
jgi:hypothetical protein